VGVARLLAGKPALAPYPPNQPHDFTYVLDFARALETLIDAGASPILGNFLSPVMVSQPSRAGVEATIRFPAKSKIDLTEVGATTWIFVVVKLRESCSRTSEHTS
jgi:hypothetical protein